MLLLDITVPRKALLNGDYLRGVLTPHKELINHLRRGPSSHKIIRPLTVRLSKYFTTKCDFFFCQLIKYNNGRLLGPHLFLHMFSDQTLSFTGPGTLSHTAFIRNTSFNIFPSHGNAGRRETWPTDPAEPRRVENEKRSTEYTFIQGARK